MARGPAKSFDPAEALNSAMVLFWEKGYAATGMAELQSRMGLGAKSLYDTFGNKRKLYFAALEHYTATVVARLFADLSTKRSPLGAANGVLRSIAKLDRDTHRGCLLGVAMAQAQVQDDAELAEHIEAQLSIIESALYDTFEQAKRVGELQDDIDARALARLYTAVFQGVNLTSRIKPDATFSNSVGRVLELLVARSNR